MISPIVEVNSLNKRYPVYGAAGKLGKAKNFITAVEDVSFCLYTGETYGLVGESGSGKTTVGRSVLNLIKADDGSVSYQGVNLLGLSGGEFKKYRRDLQMVFQNPYSALNPRKRIGSLLEEPLKVHKYGTREQRQERAFEILQTVGLQPEHYFRFPHELSGGQRQRVGIARALILEPKVIICDEPVSALDVSIQAQILNLLIREQKKQGLALLFITHDISVVRHVSDRIGVMYAGSIVEEAAADKIFTEAIHPYTKTLLAAVPDITFEKRKEQSFQKEKPLVKNDFNGCKFYHRCPAAMEICQSQAPKRKETGTGHVVSCHLVDCQ